MVGTQKFHINKRLPNLQQLHMLMQNYRKKKSHRFQKTLELDLIKDAIKFSSKAKVILRVANRSKDLRK